VIIDRTGQFAIEIGAGLNDFTFLVKIYAFIGFVRVCCRTSRQDKDNDKKGG